ncbi:TPA: alpha/beta hydrolase [Escherichia coli]|nr:alpha/beta hydrolase [Escherichia coli]HBB0495501.1 alpha/beta hydrolase [Escherichia coli]
MPTIESLYYTDSGPHNGGSGFPVIVMIPDLLTNVEIFKNQKTFLSRKYRVIVLDYQNGMFFSKENNGDILKDVAKNIIQLMDLLGIKKFIVCGIRMGGLIALNTGFEYQDRVCGMIVMGGWSEVTNHINNQRYMLLKDEHKSHRERNDIISNILQDVTGGNRKEFRYWKKIWHSYNASALNSILLTISEPLNIEITLDKIYQPVLFMHGNDDKEVPVQSAYELEKKIKHSRFIVIPGGGHIFTITHSQTTNNVIQFWLRDYFC